jgi:hypothetical protein
MMNSSGFSCSYRPVFWAPTSEEKRYLILRSFLKRKPKERTKGQPYANVKHTRMVTASGVPLAAAGITPLDLKSGVRMVYLHPTKGWRSRFVAGF